MALDLLERDYSDSPDDRPDPLRHSVAAASKAPAWASCSELEGLPVREPRGRAPIYCARSGTTSGLVSLLAHHWADGLRRASCTCGLIRHFLLPNPLVNYQFLIRRNTLLLALVLISFRFVMLATVVSIPSFLGSVRGFLPLQEAPVLIWVALPQFVLGVAAMSLMRTIDPRLILTAGFGLVGVACLLDARVTSVWAGPNFGIAQAVMAIGLALAFNSMVGSIVLGSFRHWGLDTTRRRVDICRLSSRSCAYLAARWGQSLWDTSSLFENSFTRICLASTFNLELALPITGSSGFNMRSLRIQQALTAIGRAAEVLGLQVRQQAFTLAISDSFLLLAACCVACLVVVAFMSTVPTQYRQVTAAPVEAK